MSDSLRQPPDALSFQLDLLYLCANTYQAGPQMVEEVKRIQKIAKIAEGSPAQSPRPQ